MKLNKAQEEIIKRKVGGSKQIVAQPVPTKIVATTMALGEEGNSPGWVKIY